MNISVVVPCRNAETTLGQQLAALARQSVAPFEVIIADNGSTDATLEIAQSFAGQFNEFHIVDASAVRGASHARNVGARRAFGTHLAFCDADDVVDDDWLEAIQEALRSNDFVASRFEHAVLNEKQTSTAQERGLQNFRTPFLPFSGGSGLAIITSAHRAVGGFDEGLRALEDVDYCIRVQLSGTPLVFAADAVVHVRNSHRPDISFWASRRATFLKAHAWSHGMAELSIRYRDQGMELPGILERLAVLGPLFVAAVVTGRHNYFWRLGWHVGVVHRLARHRFDRVRPSLPGLGPLGRAAADLRKVADHGTRRVIRERLRRSSSQVPATDLPAVVFAPHQDDETLGCGGVIAQKRALGQPVHVVFMTDGRACFDELTPSVPMTDDEVVALRRGEALAALGELGVTPDDITFLDCVDGHLDRLSSSERARLEDHIAQILCAVQPGEIYMPYRVDVHPDHIATHDLVRSAVAKSGLRVERWQYLIWSLWRPEHLDQFRAAGCPGLRRVSIQPVRKAKKRALAHYRSQFEPIGERRPAVPTRLRSFMTETDEFFVVDRSAVERAAGVERMDDRFPEKDRELL